MVALACLSVLASAEARADDLSLNVPVLGESAFGLTTTTIARWRGDNYDRNPEDDDFFSLYERFEVYLQGEEVRIESRTDGFFPLGLTECPPERSENCYIESDLHAERFSVRWERGDYRVEAGDAQLILGRGIALSFRKEDLLGLDNSLQGGHVTVNGERLRFEAHGGVANPQNLDPIDLRILDTPRDWVIATSAGATLGADYDLTVGGQYVRVWFEDDDNSSNVDRSVDVFGWFAEMPALLDGQLSLYVEADAMLRRQTFSFTDEESRSSGRAVYGSAQVQTERVTLLAEWKDYADFLVAPSVLEGNVWRVYGSSPTVEIDGPQRIRGQANHRGGSLRLDYAFMPGPWSFRVQQVAYGLAEEAGSDPWDGVLVTHSAVGLTRRQEWGDDIKWDFDILLGYRRETYLHDPINPDVDDGDLDQRMIHGSLSASVGWDEHAFELSADHRGETERRLTLTDFQQGGVSVTYSWRVKLAATATVRWSDENASVTEDRQDELYGFLGGSTYPSVEFKWIFSPGTFTSIFAGATPGGRLCSGGVCRDVPPFEGISLQFVGRL